MIWEHKFKCSKSVSLAVHLRSTMFTCRQILQSIYYGSTCDEFENVHILREFPACGLLKNIFSKHNELDIFSMRTIANSTPFSNTVSISTNLKSQHCFQAWTILM